MKVCQELAYDQLTIDLLNERIDWGIAKANSPEYKLSAALNCKMAV